MRSRAWYVIGAVIAAVGWVGATAYTAGAWDQLRGSTVTPVGQPFDGSGHDVAVLTDLPQPGREIACEAVGPGEERTPIPSDSVVDVTVSSDGTRWHLIALMEDGREQMSVECRPSDERSDSAIYGYAVVDDLDARDRAGSLLAWGSLAAGAAIIAATAWRRARP
ncbi:hypothetical protein EHW97_07410 [Aeromicrobium camelliae]|uniref:Uncharacterized protein n=1 Tax=Aeromicrobium camelliae TaxID=1538144 RepID=A0A3N6WKM5_9ACTN|nr:hypothetical protein [Aeromicrobium camelliae]RQN08136.1 hypothetical protein EHW97_07410 [Aeromicrobium camelliae]